MELLYEMINREVLSGQFLLSAEIIPHWRESPTSGKVHFHNLYSMSHLWWRGKERILKVTQTQKPHTSPEAMETLSTKSSNFEVWRKQLLSSNSVQRHKDLFVILSSLFSPCSIELVSFLIVLQDKLKSIRTTHSGDCTPDLCRTSKN